jgi:catechol 2,3-dioxygenase-like lactoylglutathione lyase family enzyme
VTMSDPAKTDEGAVRTVSAMTPRIDAIEVVVADMATALAFYRRLGLPIPADADAEPHVSVKLPGGLHLLFDTQDTIRSFDPSWTPPAGGHGLALAFDCGEAADVDATHDALVAAGHRSHLAPWDAFWGQRYATVLDPDGNAVDLFAALPSG